MHDHIPVFIIHLKKRTERKEHILHEFESLNEFKTHLVEAQENKAGSMGLISHRVHGNPSEIAGRIGVSRSTLYEYMQVLACYGGKITYDRHKQCFYYEENSRRKLKFDGNYRDPQ